MTISKIYTNDLLVWLSFSCIASNFDNLDIKVSFDISSFDETFPAISPSCAALCVAFTDKAPPPVLREVPRELPMEVAEVNTYPKP